MKNRKLWVGIPLIVLVFGVLMIGCDLPVEEDALIGKWYPTINDAINGTNLAFEFFEGGKMIYQGTTFTYESLGSNFTFKLQSGQTVGTAKITISADGTELDMGTGGPIKKGKYYKVGSSSSGGGSDYDDVVAKPSAFPAGGDYDSPQYVRLATATEGANIYYTRDGTAPTASSTQYSDPFWINANTTLKAIAVKDFMDNSPIMTEVYTFSTPSVTVETPAANPAGGNYTTAQTVTLATTTAGAIIYYTTNGIDPTISSAQYSTSIAISVTTTLKAIAVKDNVTSGVLTEQYNFSNSNTSSLTVTSNDDTYTSGTLRYVIDNAYDGATITFNSGITSIELKSSLYLRKNVTIEGNGVVLERKTTTAWTGSNNSLVQVEAGKTVIIRGVSLKGGKELAGGLGGAIYNLGNLTVESCIFDNNQAVYGGAIYSVSTAISTTVKGCTFYNNKATDWGGAIFISGGTLALTGNLFYGNTATDYGPVVDRKSPSITVTSGGYNVVDVDYGTGKTQSGWTAGTLDTTFSAKGISGVPFNTTTFAPVAGLKNIMPSTVISGFPTKDFNGDTRTWPGAPGAVK